MNDFQITLPALSLPAVNQLLKALSLLPLGESRPLHDFIEAEAERQVVAQRERMVLAAIQARAAANPPPAEPPPAAT